MRGWGETLDRVDEPLRFDDPLLERELVLVATVNPPGVCPSIVRPADRRRRVRATRRACRRMAISPSSRMAPRRPPAHPAPAPSSRMSWTAIRKVS